MRLGFGLGAFFLILEVQINTSMRYHELLEAMYPVGKSLEKIKKGVALIKRDCQPYLSQVEDPMKLRRGVARDYKAEPKMGRPLFNKKQAHLTGRQPRGAQMQKHHHAVNKYFTKKFGLPFRNGVMSTGDQVQSSGFGTDVAIFPIGEFSFLWSPTVTDLNHQIISDPWSESILGADTWESDQERILINLINKAGYQNTDLQAAIESKNEIMIWCEEYYTLDNNVDRLLAKKLLK